MRIVLIIGVIAVSALAWTLIASFAFAFFGRVPFHCWFYYAIPWPDDFWWDGACLVFSGSFASMPFVIAGQWTSRSSNGGLYGQTGWATPKQMNKGGLRLRGKL